MTVDPRGARGGSRLRRLTPGAIANGLGATTGAHVVQNSQKSRLNYAWGGGVYKWSHSATGIPTRIRYSHATYLYPP